MSVFNYIDSSILTPVNGGQLLSITSDNVVRICKEIRYHLLTGSKIFVYGDYDMDGLCSMLVWKEQFKTLNHSNVEFFQYRRRTHAIDASILEQVRECKPACVIICDTGSSFDDQEVLSQLRSYGISVIIIDHHKFNGDYDSYAETHLIFNSHAESKALSGCTVSAAYACLLVIGELCKMIPHAVVSNNSKIFALASMYSDIVDLSSVYGRALYNNVATISLKGSALLSVLNTYNYQLGRRLFSYIIAPPINACFRSENFTPLNMLVGSEDRCQLQLAWDKAVAQHKKTAPFIKQVASSLKPIKIGGFAVCELSGTDTSLINYTGLLATEIAKAENMSAVVFTKSRNIYKGSFRDSQSRQYLDKFSLFCNAGGHGGAFGLTFSDKSEFLRNIKILSTIGVDCEGISPTIIPSSSVENEDEVLAVVLYNEYMNYKPGVFIEVNCGNPALTSATKYSKEYDVGLPLVVRSNTSLAVNSRILVEPCLCRKPELRVV